MTASLKDLFPQKDLLDTVGDVETQLRARRRVGVVGWFAFAYTGVQAAVVVANTSSLGPAGAGAGSALQRYWPLLLALLLFVLAAALVVWYYVSLRASRHAFRFTFSIDGFEPLPNTPPLADERLAYLAADLSERLARNITRLRLRDPDPDGDASSGAQESHVRIRGNYAVREQRWSEDDDDGGAARVLRVTVWIRVGTQGSAESLAHPVSVDVQPEGLAASPVGATSSLGPAQYEALLNRVYFHVASEVYKRVRADVRRRIRLLPTARLRVAACMAEADDYAGSPTFDAYSDAAEFYEEAIFAYGGRPTPRPPVQQLLHGARLLPHALWSRSRSGLAWNVWSGLARPELRTARAEVGYAAMTINRQMLAMLSGKRNVVVGLARACAERAEARLEALPLTDEVRDARFDAKTALAIAWLRLDAPERARERLRQARALAPLRAETDPRYLLAQALQEADPRIARERFRHAVESNPADDEIAQYLLAEACERVWRSRLVDGPDRETAALVCREYQRVLQINPGNLSASTAIGYIRWLLGEEQDLAAAEEAFRYGLEYKRVQRDTYVAELDYALARTLAEQGRFAEAYSHFTSAESAIEASGMAYGQAAFAPTSWRQGRQQALDPVIQKPWTRSSAFHDYIAPLMRDRYTRYRDAVARFHDQPSAAGGDTSRRLRDVVYGWVLTDYGEACEAYSRRSGDAAWHERALDSLHRALEVDTWQVMARYDLYCLERPDPEEMRRLESLAPQWLRPRLDSLREIPPAELHGELEALLPHYWLRTAKNGDIDPRVLLQRGSGTEHRWEAEFEDAHVEALKRWGIRYPDGLSSRPPGLAEADIDRVRTAVLEHIRRHFRTDFEVLTWLSPPDAARSLHRWWAQDPVSWERLQWVWLPHRSGSAGDLATSGAREELAVLLAAAESPSWSSPIVTRWLADRLGELATAGELDADARRRAEAARARCLAQTAPLTP